jgi:toxin ParE1/3/4
MKIIWTQSALDDLQNIREFIHEQNPMAVKRISSRIQEVAQLIAEHPAIGKSGRLKNTKEIVITGTPFFITYSVRAENTLIFIRVLDGARKWP